MKKLIELGKKYLNLKQEILENQIILKKYKDEIEFLINKEGIDIVSENGIVIEKEYTESSKFDTNKYKKANSTEYERYRISSKRFSQDKLKEEQPELFKKYTIIEKTSSINIRKIIKTLEPL